MYYATSSTQIGVWFSSTSIHFASVSSDGTVGFDSLSLGAQQSAVGKELPSRPAAGFTDKAFQNLITDPSSLDAKLSQV